MQPLNICCCYFMFLTEIPGFLSEEECRMVVQLAQLKGLMDSQTAAPNQGQEESNQPLLSLSTEEVFSLLDLNQDGLLQKQEVTTEEHNASTFHTDGSRKKTSTANFMNRQLFGEMRKVIWSFFQIVSHSRSRDGTWLSPDNLRQILTGLEDCPTGLLSQLSCVSVYLRQLWLITFFLTMSFITYET